jgi:hypothetical protein
MPDRITLVPSTLERIGQSLSRLRALPSSLHLSHRIIIIFLIRILGGGIQLGPLDTSATNWPNVPAPCGYEDGGFGGMMIGRGNRNSRRKPAPVPLFHSSVTVPTWALLVYSNNYKNYVNMTTEIHDNNANITIQKNVNKNINDAEGCGPQCTNFPHFLRRVNQA